MGKKLVIRDGEIIGETQKAYLIGFPETSEYKDYAIWFPKRKVSQDGKNLVIQIMNEQYTLTRKSNFVLSLEEVAKEYNAEIQEN